MNIFNWVLILIGKLLSSFCFTLTQFNALAKKICSGRLNDEQHFVSFECFDIDCINCLLQKQIIICRDIDEWRQNAVIIQNTTKLIMLLWNAAVTKFVELVRKKSFWEADDRCDLIKKCFKQFLWLRYQFVVWPWNLLSPQIYYIYVRCHHLAI